MKRLFRNNGGDDHNFWMSYTDLMSGFLVVFIICSLVMYNNYSRKKKEYESLCDEILHINPDSLKHQLDSIKVISSMKNLINEYNDVFPSTDLIKVSLNPARGSIILTCQKASDDLFPKGEPMYKPVLENYLREHAVPMVRKTIELSEKVKAIELRIEGHTDPTWEPYKSGSPESFKENLDLSSKRANTVYKYILNRPELKEKERNFVMENMISVGYSFSECLQDGRIEDENLYPSYRRIEFRIISK